MANTTTKVFTIELQGKTDSLEKQLAAAQKAAAQVGGELVKGFSKTNNQLGSTKTVLTLVTRQLLDAQTVADRFNKAFAAAGTNLIVFKNGTAELERTLRGVTATYADEGQKQIAIDKDKAARQLAFAQEQAHLAGIRVAEAKRRAKEQADWEIEQHKRKMAEFRRLDDAEASRNAARIAQNRADAQAAFGALPVAVPKVNATTITPVAPPSGRFNYGTGSFTPPPKLPPEVPESYKSFFARVIEGISIYRAFTTAINLTQQALLSIPRAGINLEGTTATLTAVFESEAMAAKQMVFLREEAARTGIALTQLRNSYKTFAASALLAGESVETVNDIFKNINTTAATLHLSAEQVDGVFLAFSQMFNKGKIQAEELTKQLSQVLPGITNQAAKALAISVAEMQEQMKAGALSAHQSVQLIAKQVGEAFGGAGFDKAAQGLQANLGRLNTAWTTFAENIYKDSDGMLISVVRFATKTVEGMAGIADGSSGASKAVGTLVTVIEGAAAGAMVAFIANTVKANTALFTMETAGFAAKNAIVSLQTFLASNAWGIAAIAIGAAVAQIVNLRNEAENTRITVDRILNDARRDKDPEGAREFDLKNTESVKKVEEAIIAHKKQMERNRYTFYTDPRLREKQLAEDVGVLKLLETKYATEYAKAIEDTRPIVGAAYAQLPDTSNADAKVKAELTQYTEGAIAGAKERALHRFKEEIDSYKAVIIAGRKRIDEADAALRANGKLDISANIDARKAGAESIANAERKLKEIQQIADGAADKVASKGNSKTNIAVQKDIVADFTKMKESITGGLAELDAAYANSEINIHGYYVSKRALLEQDHALEIEQRNAALQQAFASKDRVKVAQLQIEIAKENNSWKRKSIDLITEEAASMRELTREVAAMEAQYSQFQGNTKQAALQNFDLQNEKLIAKVKAGQAANDPEAIAIGKRIEAARQYAGVQAELQSRSQQSQIISDQLANKELQIQAAQKVGAITELDALYKIQTAREEYIKQQEQIVANNEAMVVSGQIRDAMVIQQIKNARAQLDAFKLEADLVGQKFQTIFTENFSNGFKAFVTGAANAKEAFNIFAKGVIGNIAEIAAQQASQQILSLLVGGVKSIAGGITFGGGADLNPVLPAANGHVVSGISAASSSILTRPTLFPGAKVVPFASGGVLAGEAGKEGVLPLKRIGGKLGVSAEGLGGGGNSVIIQNLSVTVVEKKGTSAAEQADLVGTQVKQQVQALIDQKFAVESRPGGKLAAKR